VTVESIETSQIGTEHPVGWRTVRFDAMAEIVNDRVDDPAEAGVEYYVGLEHLDPESLKIRRWGKPTDVEATKLRFKPGDISFGRRRAYQRKLAVAEFEGICSAHAMVLRAREDVVLPEFLPFFMQSEIFFERAMSISVGSLSPTINWKTLAAQEFALPPRDEQRRIAEILWAADEAILKAQDVVQALGQYRSIFFETTLEQGMQNDWSHVDFGSLWTASPQSGHSAVPSGRAPGHYVLALSALTPRGYQQGELKPVEISPQIAAARLTKGDLLISRSNTIELVGLAGIFDEDREDISFPDTMMLVRVDESMIDKSFLMHFLLSKTGRSQLRRIAAGTSASMKKINRVGLSSVKIPVPELAAQKNIMNLILKCDSSAISAVAKLTHTQTLYQALREEFSHYGFRNI
jgi:type I restriction enzyme S subunit